MATHKHGFEVGQTVVARTNDELPERTSGGCGPFPQPSNLTPGKRYRVTGVDGAFAGDDGRFVRVENDDGVEEWFFVERFRPVVRQDKTVTFKVGDWVELVPADELPEGEVPEAASPLVKPGVAYEVLDTFASIGFGQVVSVDVGNMDVSVFSWRFKKATPPLAAVVKDAVAIAPPASPTQGSPTPAPAAPASPAPAFPKVLYVWKEDLGDDDLFLCCSEDVNEVPVDAGQVAKYELREAGRLESTVTFVAEALEPSPLVEPPCCFAPYAPGAAASAGAYASSHNAKHGA